MIRPKILTMLIILLSLILIIPQGWAWEIDRPKVSIILGDRVENATTNGEASVSVGASIGNYIDYYQPYGYRDLVTLNVSTTANSRVGITYTKENMSSCWISKGYLTNPTEISDFGNDTGMWFNFPSHFVFRFYGGSDSAEYRSVWVSSNGFISFDLSNSTSASPRTIPWDVPPNALIAALWTDLDVDSSASIITGLYEGGMPGRPTDNYYVITWNNALHGQSGKRLTFQIALENASSYYIEGILNRQSDIRIDYRSVSSINTKFSYGIEDNEGLRGNGGFYNGEELAVLNGKNVWFKQNSSNFFLNSLTLKGNDDTGTTGLRVDKDADLLRGYHVITGPNSDVDPHLRFKKALLGSATLLITVGGLLLDVTTWPYTLPINFITVGSAWIDHLAYLQYSEMTFTQLRDESSGAQGSFYISVPTWSFAVDASMNIVLYWILPPDETQSYAFTLTAELQYYEHDVASGETTYKNATTSVNLKVAPDISNDFSNPKSISAGIWYEGTLDTIDIADMYIVSVPRLTQISIQMGPPADANYDLFLYWPNRTLIGGSTFSGNSIEYINYNVGELYGDYYIKVSLTFWPEHTNSGIYRLIFTANAPVHNPSGGNAGCPYVSTWDGGKYILDNNVLPASVLGNGTDVEDYYRLEQTLVPKNGKYSLLLSEFENEHSYIDQVKLLAVDHESDVNIAVTQGGEILTYKNPAPPMSAVDNNGTDRLNEISLIEGNVSDQNTYFFGEPGDYLTLNFGQVSSDNAKLILRTDYKKMVECILVQVKDASGGWQTVEVLVPRAYWSTQAVNLSPYVIPGQELWVRLYWKYPHRLDYVGLDTTKQADYEVHTANLVSAVHSAQGDVKALLQENDNVYAELVPGQQIQLEFTLPNNAEEARTYILYSEGHYYTIT